MNQVEQEKFLDDFKMWYFAKNVFDETYSDDDPEWEIKFCKKVIEIFLFTLCDILYLVEAEKGASQA